MTGARSTAYSSKYARNENPSRSALVRFTITMNAMGLKKSTKKPKKASGPNQTEFAGAALPLSSPMVLSVAERSLSVPLSSKRGADASYEGGASSASSSRASLAEVCTSAGMKRAISMLMLSSSLVAISVELRWHVLSLGLSKLAVRVGEGRNEVAT